MAIPKAVREAHLRENFAAAAITLAPEDLAALDAIFPPPRRKTALAMVWERPARGSSHNRVTRRAASRSTGRPGTALPRARRPRRRELQARVAAVARAARREAACQARQRSAGAAQHGRPRRAGRGWRARRLRDGLQREALGSWSSQGAARAARRGSSGLAGICFSSRCRARWPSCRARRAARPVMPAAEAAGATSGLRACRRVSRDLHDEVSGVGGHGGRKATAWAFAHPGPLGRRRWWQWSARGGAGCARRSREAWNGDAMPMPGGRRAVFIRRSSGSSGGRGWMNRVAAQRGCRDLRA